MRISDWSSDVCSSDLALSVRLGRAETHRAENSGEIGREQLVLFGGGKLAFRHHEEDVVGAHHIGLALLDRRRLFLQLVVDRGLPHIDGDRAGRSEEHTSELQSLMRISYAVFFLKK